MNGCDIVRGTIIGGSAYRYEFWTESNKPELIHNGSQSAREYFTSDAEAVKWFRANFPAAFQAGAEMRCFDR